MKILVTLGPIIGCIIIIIYSIYLKLNTLGTHSKSIHKSQKLFYTILLGIEIILLLVSFLVPRITGESYLLNGMSTGSKYTIAENIFRVSYKEANREFRNNMYLTNKQLSNLYVYSSSDNGTVSLNIAQENNIEEIDITNMHSKIDMSNFEEGYITFTLKNNKAHNVVFELEFE